MKRQLSLVFCMGIAEAGRIHICSVQDCHFLLSPDLCQDCKILLKNIWYLFLFVKFQNCLIMFDIVALIWCIEQKTDRYSYLKYQFQNKFFYFFTTARNSKCLRTTQNEKESNILVNDLHSIFTNVAINTIQVMSHKRGTLTDLSIAFHIQWMIKFEDI